MGLILRENISLKSILWTDNYQWQNITFILLLAYHTTVKEKFITRFEKKNAGNLEKFAKKVPKIRKNDVFWQFRFRQVDRKIRPKRFGRFSPKFRPKFRFRSYTSLRVHMHSVEKYYNTVWKNEKFSVTKKISSNQLFSNLFIFSKTVTFTIFLLKKSVREFLLFPQCV